MRIVGILLAAVMLVSCTPANAPGPVSTVQVEDESTFDQAFVKAFDNEFGHKPSNEIVIAARTTGHAACAALDSGTTADQIVGVVIASANGDSDKAMVSIIAIGVGVRVYCPQHVDKFK